MQSRSHPSVLMDRIYRNQRHIYDVTRKFFLLGRDSMIRDLNVPDGGRVLEVGCGTGRNLVVAARKNPQGLFYGVDISSEMLKSAEANISHHKMTNRVYLAHGNAVNFVPEDRFGIAGFDRIFMSYTLSMIGPWREALLHAISLLAPDGQLHIVDFGQQSKLPGWFKKALHQWLARFHVEPRHTLQGFLDETAKNHNLHISFRPALRDYICLAVITKPAN